MPEAGAEVELVHLAMTHRQILAQMAVVVWLLQLQVRPLLVLAAVEAAEIQAQDQAVMAAEETERQVREQVAAQGQLILAAVEAAVIRQATAVMAARA
jgi:predicted membrane-bound mannosyltransferase